MLRDGCALRIGPVLAVSAPLVLAGTGPGNGTLSLPVTLAPGTLGTVTLEALLVDPGSPRGWSASNAVEVTVR